ncbi:MAG TPA: aminoglycoside phosphotransferase family protein, partial [Solirubrobacterales bacterium]
MNARVVRRRDSEYRTSFPIEELEVELPGEGRTTVVCKRLDREALDEAARLAKPFFLHVDGREAYVYERLLPRGPAGPPRFLGAERDIDGSRLFIEWIDGRVLFEVGERELWEEAAGWLGRFHAAFEGALGGLPVGAPLVERDADFLRLWLVRARAFAASGPGGGAALEWLAARHERVVEALAAMGPTILHGEFYASNVLVAAGEGGATRVAPVDWELAGPGPGALDLAALVCGWPRAGREAMRRAYAAGRGRELPDRELDLARLQVAIQWLGWAP